MILLHNSPHTTHSALLRCSTKSRQCWHGHENLRMTYSSLCAFSTPTFGLASDFSSNCDTSENRHVGPVFPLAQTFNYLVPDCTPGRTMAQPALLRAFSLVAVPTRPFVRPANIARSLPHTHPPSTTSFLITLRFLSFHTSLVPAARTGLVPATPLPSTPHTRVSLPIASIRPPWLASVAFSSTSCVQTTPHSHHWMSRSWVSRVTAPAGHSHLFPPLNFKGFAPSTPSAYTLLRLHIDTLSAQKSMTMVDKSSLFFKKKFFTSIYRDCETDSFLPAAAAICRLSLSSPHSRRDQTNSQQLHHTNPHMVLLPNVPRWLQAASCMTQCLPCLLQWLTASARFPSHRL